MEEKVHVLTSTYTLSNNVVVSIEFRGDYNEYMITLEGEPKQTVMVMAIDGFGSTLFKKLLATPKVESLEELVMSVLSASGEFDNTQKIELN